MRFPRFNRRTPPHIVTLVIISGLAAMTMNVMLPSLPGMARYFGVDYAVMQLTVSGYLAFSAVLQLVVGPITDRFGRRPVILGAMVLFLLSTLGTLWAPTAGWFLLFRMGQAVIATTMALSRAVVRDMVPGPQAASMIGYVTMGMSLGGALDEAFGWQANILLLGVAGVAVTALAWADLGETGTRHDGGLRKQMAQYPALFASRRFWGYCLAATFSSGGFFAYLGGAPFVGSEIFRLSPATLGYFFGVPAIGYSLGNFLSGRYSVRLGVDRMVLFGASLATIALFSALLVVLLGVSHPLVFFPAVGVMALGNGLTLPNANSGMMSVRPELAGTASGLGGAMSIGGGAALAAVAGVLLVPGGTEAPLLALMALSSIASVFSILWVMRRRARLGV
jgi:DHA1 family bicyclomycin/chloramphenicol resistance-like MFS transporter